MKAGQLLTSRRLNLELGTKNFNIQYGLGSAEMTSATDKFGIAGMSVDQFDFGSAHTVSQLDELNHDPDEAQLNNMSRVLTGGRPIYEPLDPFRWYSWDSSRGEFLP